MKKYYIIGTIVVLLLITIPLTCYYIIQRTVCSEMQDMTRIAGDYYIFTGCSMQIKVGEKIDFENGAEPAESQEPVKNNVRGGK